jgi:CheY-like chemotaxis protein
MTAKTILLVEDSTADAYLIQRAVKACGPDLQFCTTADGGEALQWLRKATPTLILIDLRLPKMSGTQLLAEIRQLPAYEATPIIILSRLEEEREAALCLHLRASAYVQKSANFHAFFHSITELVTHWQQEEGEREERPSASLRRCLVLRHVAGFFSH